MSDGKRAIEELRAEIARLDVQLLGTLEKRAHAARKLGEHRRGLPTSLPPGDRAALQALVSGPVRLTPMVLSAAEAEPWLHDTEGVIAKELTAPYRPGERKGMVKVKRLRTVDAVVAGWRPGKEEGTLGALILGLYTPDGELRVVGHSSGFTAKRKRELPGELAPYESGARGTGDPSRWKSAKELEWIGLRPELVVEVSFDQVSDGRIRHGARVLRWREDKPPRECTVDQLDA